MRVRQAIKALEIIWEKERRHLAGVSLPRDVLGLICKSLRSTVSEPCWGVPQTFDRYPVPPPPPPSPQKNLKWKYLGVAAFLGAMYMAITNLVI